MRNAMRPQAVMSVVGTFANICSACSDKADADAWAAAHGLTASHGFCDECKERICTEVIFEAGERCVAPGHGNAPAARGTAMDVPSRPVVFSCRLGGGKG